MKQIQHFQLDARACEYFDTIVMSTIGVDAGWIWASVEGLPDDHWLGCGDTLAVAAGKRVWLSAEARLNGCSTLSTDMGAALHIVQARHGAPRDKAKFFGRLISNLGRMLFKRHLRRTAA